MSYGDDVKRIVIDLYSKGKSAAEIRKDPLVPGVSKSTINKWISKYEHAGDDIKALDVQPRPGRPRKTTDEEDALIVASCRAQPLRPAISVVSEVLPKFRGAKQTIYRRLREGLRSPADKTNLTPQQTENEHTFEDESVNNPLDDCLELVWSDETTFKGDSNGDIYRGKKRGTRNDAENVVKKKKSLTTSSLPTTEDAREESASSLQPRQDPT